MNRLRIKAGHHIYAIIKDGGFHFDAISTFFGPAVGPRWLTASGFDLTLLQSGLLGRKRPLQLVGSSAGAFRFAAWIQPQAQESYHKLMEAYISMRYTRNDTPRTCQEKMIDLINHYIEDDALPFALANKNYRLAVITARARGFVAWENPFLQKLGLATCFMLNFVSRENIHRFAERVVFYNASKPPTFCLKGNFRGTYIPLNEINFKYAVLASGSIPLVIEGVRDIYGAPRGVYRDGGLIDYHLTHQFASRKDEMVLFFHHQERIIPGWLDKKLKKRVPDKTALNNVLMVFPTQHFIETLPEGKVPERSDFITYLDDPQTRIQNWRTAVKLCAPLGEEFLELVESGRIRDVVEKL